MIDVEKEEALAALCAHYGMPLFLELIDGIVGRIAGGVMSVPLDKDPEKAALTLYAERMKAEGAVAVKNAVLQKVQQVKQQIRENKK
jgi:hypothetical protein